MKSEALDGQVALVTGGGSGIGAAAAFSLARRGAHVILFGPDDQSLAATVEQMNGENLDVEAVPGDVTIPEATESVVNLIRDRIGRLDALVNSAGIQTYGSVESTIVRDWERVIAVNLTGTYLMSRSCIPLLRASGGGAIVNVASVQGIACQRGVAAYVASKGGVLALTRAMAVDHAADGIRVNAVCPGTIDTPLVRAEAELFKGTRDVEQLLADWGRTHALGRVGRPEEVGEVIAFLCESRSSFCTGAEFRVDGGLLAQLAAPLQV